MPNMKSSTISKVEKSTFPGTVGLGVAVLGLGLSLATAYFTLVQQRFRLTLVHPLAAIRVERENQEIRLTISGNRLNTPGITFVNGGNQPVVVSDISYVLDLNSDVVPSCTRNFHYVLTDEKFKPTVVKPTESVPFDSVFLARFPYSDWVALFKHEYIHGLVCIVIQVADGDKGAREFTKIFGAVKIPKHNLEMFEESKGVGVGMLVPIGTAENGLIQLVNYNRWF